MKLEDLLPPGFPPLVEFSCPEAARWLGIGPDAVSLRIRNGYIRASRGSTDAWKIPRVEMFRLMGIEFDPMPEVAA